MRAGVIRVVSHHPIGVTSSSNVGCQGRSFLFCLLLPCCCFLFLYFVRAAPSLFHPIPLCPLPTLLRPHTLVLLLCEHAQPSRPRVKWPLLDAVVGGRSELLAWCLRVYAPANLPSAPPACFRQQQSRTPAAPSVPPRAACPPADRVAPPDQVPCPRAARAPRARRPTSSASHAPNCRSLPDRRRRSRARGWSSRSNRRPLPPPLLHPYELRGVRATCSPSDRFDACAVARLWRWPPGRRVGGAPPLSAPKLQQSRVGGGLRPPPRLRVEAGHSHPVMISLPVRSCRIRPPAVAPRRRRRPAGSRPPRPRRKSNQIGRENGYKRMSGHMQATRSSLMLTPPAFLHLQPSPPSFSHALNNHASPFHSLPRTSTHQHPTRTPA